MSKPMKKINRGFFKKSHALRKFYFSRNFQLDHSPTTRNKHNFLTLSPLKSRPNYFLKDNLEFIRVNRTLRFLPSQKNEFFPRNLTFIQPKLFRCLFQISASKIMPEFPDIVFSGQKIDFPNLLGLKKNTKDNRQTPSTSPTSSSNNDGNEKVNSWAPGIKHSTGFLSLDDFADDDQPISVLLRNSHFIPPRKLTPLLAQAIEPEYPSLTTMAFKPKRKPFKYSRISIWRNQLRRLNASYGTSWTEDWDGTTDADWEDITVSPKSPALHEKNATSPSTKSSVTTDSHELSPTSLDFPFDNSLWS